MRSDEGFKYKLCGLDRIIEEKGSSFIAMREIAWGVGEHEEVDYDKIKIDIRKYFSTAEGEKMNKGISLTRECAGELAHVLLEENFGDTEKCLSILKERDDFKEAANNVYNTDKVPSEYIDPRELFL